MLKYARFKLFQYFLFPFSQRMRRRRMHLFVDNVELREGMSVIDLGGAPEIWRYVDTPLKITMVNLEYSAKVEELGAEIKQHEFNFLIGDACRVEFPSNSFDLVFSNSVIEHVGGQSKRADFAQEVIRLAPRYWVQTPSRYFPIEAHTGMPFWWYYPESLRRRMKANWHKKLPAWTDMIEGTDIVEQAELQKIFPGARILKERLAGVVKSYVAFRA